MRETRELKIEEVNGRDGLEMIRAEWRALFAAASAPPFLSWEWMTTWQDSFGRDRKPRVLCARADGKLLGLLPLSIEESRFMGLPIRMRRLSLMGEKLGGADYLDLLALPGCEQEVTNAFLTYLAEDDSFDYLELNGLAADSLTLPLLTRHFGDSTRFRFLLKPRDLSPQVRIEGDWEEFLRQSQRVSYLSRCLRRLHKLPGYEFRTVIEPAEVPAAFDRFLKLHEMAWASRGGSGAIRNPTEEGFLREVVIRLAQDGGVRFEEIWIDGVCRAALFGLNGGDRFYFYLNGFDPAWSKYSLGFTLLWLSVESAARRGVKVYDMLRGSESYKFFWANSARATVVARVMSRSLPAKLSFALEQTAETLRVMLPEWVRPLHRRLTQPRQEPPAESAAESAENSETNTQTRQQSPVSLVK